jgi:hypothetical protein
MRLSVSAACNGELVINIVLTMAASVKGNMVFIWFLILILILFIAALVFNTGETMKDAPVLRHGV